MHPFVPGRPLPLGLLTGLGDELTGAGLLLARQQGLRLRIRGAVVGLQFLEDGPGLLHDGAQDNLLDNAGKYSEPDSTVCLRVTVEAAGLQFEVADQGIGIDAADLSRIGTPFFRTDRSRARRTGGVGLGLALGRRIVDAHGGVLMLESQPGVGTTVRITLPTASA